MVKESVKSSDDYTDDDALSSPWIRWGKVGDCIFGTLISVTPRTAMNQNSGKMETSLVYEIKADGGEYHDMDDKKNPIEPAVVINPGDIFNVGDHFTIHPIMKNVKLGQKIKIAFTEEKPSRTKGNAPMKVRKVFSKGVMDQEWLDEQEAKTVTGDDNF